MSDPDPTKLTEALELGKLQAEQEAQLQAYLLEHPEQREAWEEDLALNHLLKQMPDAPVSSNFAALVVQAAHQAERVSARSTNRFWERVLALGRIPKFAVAALAIMLGFLVFYQHQNGPHRDMAQTREELGNLTSRTTLDVLQNFDAIQRLSQADHDPDRELIAALQ